MQVHSGASISILIEKWVALLTEFRLSPPPGRAAGWRRRAGTCARVHRAPYRVHPLDTAYGHTNSCT